MGTDLLASLGITDEQFAAAKDSTVTEAFEVMPSGVVPGKIKEVILYKNSFGGEMLQVNVVVKHNDAERTLSFRDDIGKNLKQTDEEKKENKPGKINEGFVARLKSLCTAANVEISALKDGPATKVKSFGKDCEGKFLLGLNDKSVQALVRLSVDTTKAEGEAYRERNDIEGVLPKGHEDIAVFEAKVEKNKGIFNYKGYVKKDAAASSASAAGSAEIQAAAEKLDF